MRPGKRRALQGDSEMDRLRQALEQLKASVRAKVEHPFMVTKQQFGNAKVRYRGRAKNTACVAMLFAMSNLWMDGAEFVEHAGITASAGAPVAP